MVIDDGLFDWGVAAEGVILALLLILLLLA